MDYMRFTADGSSDLYMKRIGYDILKIAYYFESDGNRLRDPEVTLKLNVNDRTLIPVSYEQDTMAVKQKVSDGPGGMDERLLSDLDVFMNDWLTDISKQGYELSTERQDEAVMPFFLPGMMSRSSFMKMTSMRTTALAVDDCRKLYIDAPYALG